MRLLIAIAARNIVQARRRTLLLSLGLAVVAVMFVLLMSFSRSLGDTILRTATTLTTGHVNVGGFFKSTPSEAAAYITHRERLREIVARETPGFVGMVDRYRGWAQIASETDSLQTGVVGLQIAEEPALSELLALARENEYRPDGRDEVLGRVADIAEKDTIIIFAGHARQLGVTVGDRVTVISQTPDGTTNTKDLRVVAVARDMSLLSNWTVFTDQAALKELYFLPDDTTGAIHIFLRDPDDAPQAMGALREALEREGFAVMEHESAAFFMKFEKVSGEDWMGLKLDLTTWRDEVSFLVWILTVVDLLSFFLIGILVIIIAVGITNTMWISVRERTGEIGTLRAIGMSHAQVLSMILIEAAILGFGGALAGAALGGLTAVGIDAAQLPIPRGPMRAFLMTDTLQLTVQPAHLLAATLGITLVTALAALWPAIRASRLQPVTAIQRVD
jgi:putative ABC transport system permease protein